MRDFLKPIQCSDVIQRVDAGTEATVEAKDLPVNQGGQRQVVEQVGEILPDVGVAVFAQAFVVESVNLESANQVSQFFFPFFLF